MCRLQNCRRASLTKKAILGIDPGTETTGFGVILGREAIDYGCIRPPRSLTLHQKYLYIANGVEELIGTYKPLALSIETQYVKENIQSAIKLGMARGAVIVTALRLGVEVFEYTPSVAKKAVTGRGGASKAQVQAMVQRLLSLKELPTPEDAADALSLALCHEQRMNVCIAH